MVYRLKYFKFRFILFLFIYWNLLISEDENDEGVSVMLDGIESRIQFISMDIDMVNNKYYLFLFASWFNYEIFFKD